jgi:hypothetical protein
MLLYLTWLLSVPTFFPHFTFTPSSVVLPFICSQTVFLIKFQAVQDGSFTLILPNCVVWLLAILSKPHFSYLESG